LSDLIKDRYHELLNSHLEIARYEALDLAVEYAFAQNSFKKNSVGTFTMGVDLEQEKRKKLKTYIKSKLDVYKIYKELFLKGSKFKELIPANSLQIWQESVKDTVEVFKGGPGN